MIKRRQWKKEDALGDAGETVYHGPRRTTPAPIPKYFYHPPPQRTRASSSFARTLSSSLASVSFSSTTTTSFLATTSTSTTSSLGASSSLRTPFPISTTESTTHSGRASHHRSEAPAIRHQIENGNPPAPPGQWRQFNEGPMTRSMSILRNRVIPGWMNAGATWGFDATPRSTSSISSGNPFQIRTMPARIGANETVRGRSRREHQHERRMNRGLVEDGQHFGSESESDSDQEAISVLEPGSSTRANLHPATSTNGDSDNGILVLADEEENEAVVLPPTDTVTISHTIGSAIDHWLPSVPTVSETAPMGGATTLNDQLRVSLIDLLRTDDQGFRARQQQVMNAPDIVRAVSVLSTIPESLTPAPVSISTASDSIMSASSSSISTAPPHAVNSSSIYTHAGIGSTITTSAAPQVSISTGRPGPASLATTASMSQASNTNDRDMITRVLQIVALNTTVTAQTTTNHYSGSSTANDLGADVIFQIETESYIHGERVRAERLRNLLSMASAAHTVNYVEETALQVIAARDGNEAREALMRTLIDRATQQREDDDDDLYGDGLDV